MSHRETAAEARRLRPESCEQQISTLEDSGPATLHYGSCPSSTPPPHRIRRLRHRESGLVCRSAGGIVRQRGFLRANGLPRPVPCRLPGILLPAGKGHPSIRSHSTVPKGHAFLGLPRIKAEFLE